jgi:ubiquinone/menaquinone biosynthesis C-methylase UbiE
VAAGETVLDLGSGGGKICYLASQIVGPTGRVIGVDTNDEMLALARKYQREIGERIGWQNVEFRRGRIQDLALDLDKCDALLARQPIRSSADLLARSQQITELQRCEPLVDDASIDVVLSNCVLNLVVESDRRQLLGEIFRVLRPGGRAVISDIVSDRPVPEHLRQDRQLWSGCISGAFVEADFLAAFAAAGFYGLEIVARQTEPWMVVEGIEFRSLTLRAYKPLNSVQIDDEHAKRPLLIYRGPWQSVRDDSGLTLQRGIPSHVDAVAFSRLTSGPYAGQFYAVGSPSHAETNRINAECGNAKCC